MADGGEDPSRRGMKRDRERQQDEELEAAARAVRARNQALIDAAAASGNQSVLGPGVLPQRNDALALARAMAANQNPLALQQQRQDPLRAPLLGASALQLTPLSAPLGGLPPMAGVPNLLGAGGAQEPAMRNFLLSQMLSTPNQVMHVNPVAQAASLPMAAMGQLQPSAPNPALLLNQQQALQHQLTPGSLLNNPRAAVTDPSKSGPSPPGAAQAVAASLQPPSLPVAAAAAAAAPRDDDGEPDAGPGAAGPEAGFRRLRRDSESGGLCVQLYVPSDDESLSPFQCLARKHIELFEAQQEDVEAGAQGRNKPIVVGQVGIRCIHCKVLPANMRARAAVYFPSKLSVLYQACQNIVNLHLPQLCDGVPDEVRAELLSLGKKKSAVGGGKNYWSDAAEILGVRNTEGQGLRFRDITEDESE